MWKIFKQHNKGPTPNEQAVIVAASFNSGEEFGTAAEREGLGRLEEDIKLAIKPSGGELDGHDIGDGGFIIYIYGTDADDLFENIKPLLQKASLYLQSAKITKRYGPADDPDAKEETVRI